MKITGKKMGMETLLLIILTGLAAGILSGLVGVGGGIIVVPALIYFLGFSQFNAQGTSMALLLFPVGILGVLQYHRQGHVDFSVVAILAIGFIAGSFLGSKLSLSLNQDTVKRIFALLLLLISAKMLFFDKPVNKKVNSTVSINNGMEKKNI